MKSQIKNRIRAFLLLTVFSLNTVAGFACSIGIDMGYNAHHHSHETGHHHGKGMHHHHAPLPGGVVKGVSDDCCAGAVTAFNTLDKSVVGTTDQVPVPKFLLSFTASFFHPALDLKTNDVAKGFAYLDRRSWRPLYDTNLRIAIQSFQI